MKKNNLTYLDTMALTILTADTLGLKPTFTNLAKDIATKGAGVFELHHTIPFETEAHELGRQCFMKYGKAKCNSTLNQVINKYAA